jgi:hypothetical protein
MRIEDFLSSRNAGNQAWQVLRSNLTSGDHPWNFKGICQALVSQWFLEVHFHGGKLPDELGRHLLNGDLGRAGYGGLAKAQAVMLPLYDQSGESLKRATKYKDGAEPLRHGTDCSRVVLAYAFDIDVRQMEFRTSPGEVKADLAILQNIDGDPSVFSAQLSLQGVNSPWISWAIGATWGHAIGIHCNGDSLYVFDPNYGTFIIKPVNKSNVYGFFPDLWARYTPSQGILEPVTPK